MFNSFEQVHSLSKQQLVWSDCSLTHLNLSKLLHSLSKEQLAGLDAQLGVWLVAG